jgi:hypothetical protein
MTGSAPSRLRALAVAVAACVTLLLALGAASASAHSAWWLMNSSTGPTSLKPGQKSILFDTAVNAGYTDASGVTSQITMTDTLPAGLRYVAVQKAAAGVYTNGGGQVPTPIECQVSGQVATGQVVKCPVPLGPKSVVSPYASVRLTLEVEAEPSLETGAVNHVQIEGGTDGSGEELESKEWPEPGKDASQSLNVSGEPAQFGLSRFDFRQEDSEGQPTSQAGAHPFQFTSTVDFNEGVGLTSGFQGSHLNPIPPNLPKNLHFFLPRGLIGDVANRPQCAETDFDAFHLKGSDNCREDAALGVASVTLLEPTTLGFITAPVPVFNLIPAKGEPARFGFELAQVPVVLTTKVLPEDGYEVEVSVHYASQAAYVEGTQLTFWGVPGDERHNASRGWECISDGFWVLGGSEEPRPCKPSGESSPQAFLSMPTSCEDEPVARATGVAWPKKENGELREATFGGTPKDEFAFTPFTNCAALPFSPSVEYEADHPQAATPSGMTVKVKVPQDSTLSGAEGALAEAGVRKTVLTLPAGVEANAGAANSLLTCTNGQFGYIGKEPFGEDSALTGLTENTHFNTAAITCPDAAKVGTVKIITPLLEEPVEGFAYLAHIHVNPFQSPLVLFLFAEDEKAGVTVKLAGEVIPDPNTGALTSVFKETPPLPFSELIVHLLDGARASQSTPETCGTFPGAARFEPWSVSGSPAEREAQSYTPPGAGQGSLAIGQGANGAPCSPPGTQPFNPSFVAGSGGSTQGGAFAPFTVTIGRADGDQALKTISVTEPPGAAAMLASVTPCPTAEAEKAEPNCPASSAIGESTAVAGLGTSHVSLHGTAYLTGPFHGAPFGLLDVTDATHVGEFNLGHIPVMSKITVDETTAQATVTSEPAPKFVKGFPSQIHELNINVNRPGFTFNPTNCNPMPIVGHFTGWGNPGIAEGASTVTYPFVASNCGSLPFKPRLSLELEPDVSRLDGTGLVVKVKASPGEANIHKTKLVFPTTIPSRLTTIQKACDDHIFNVNPANCPEGSVIGTAIAKTPVLKSPLVGPAYLVSHANASFPDAEFVLQGEGIKLVLDGKTDIKKGITSSTFESVPDAPVESFEVKLPRGPHSAFSGFGDLCTTPQNLPTEFVGQNGAGFSLTTKAKLVSSIEKPGGAVCAEKKVKKKKTELQKLLAKCKKLKNHKKRARCQATARKQVRAVASCKKKDKRHKKKMHGCIAHARKTYALKLR